MNKTELIKDVARATGCTISNTKKILDACFGRIGEALGDGDDVSILGFGTFKTVRKKERIGRNPQTGESMTIPEHTSIKFKVGRTLAESVK